MNKIYLLCEKNGFQIKKLGKCDRILVDRKTGNIKNRKYTIESYQILFKKTHCLIETKITGHPNYKLYKIKKNEEVLIINTNSQDEFIRQFKIIFKMG